MYPDITIYRVAERVSLGQCLNCGISKAKYPLITKFDHDDYYSPYYLKEQVHTLLRTGSAVVGKHACFVYLAASQQLLVRSPLEMNKPVSFIQGGTLLFRRSILKDVRFSDITLGEDVKFLRIAPKRATRYTRPHPLTTSISVEKIKILIRGRLAIKNFSKAASLLLRLRISVKSPCVNLLKLEGYRLFPTLNTYNKYTISLTNGVFVMY